MAGNPTLFNCCPDNGAPDFAWFRAFGVRPCSHLGDTYEQVDEPHLADVWTVYGVLASEGIPMAITDAPTRKLALAIAHLFSARTGLPVEELN